jgi:modulator of FtsH protease
VDETPPGKEQDIMSDTLTYQQMGTAARGQAHTLFAQTMGYVAATAGLFALGAWAGRELAGGVASSRPRCGRRAGRPRCSSPGSARRVTPTRRDLAPVARASFWALAALIVFGIVLIFVHIPGADLVYSVLGLVIFAGFTLFNFQRVRTSTDAASAPLLAASIFLDTLNVFLFFLQIFTQDDR